ncbi:MAG: hypothetical protein C4537_06815 [Acholeplasma sp.]|nr:MAG: hypothetical protein C4537_06815 [Acholeplasma sp.]
MRKLLVILSVLSLVLMSCTEPTEPTPEVTTYTVTFDSDGGSSVTSQTVDENGVVTEPTDPTKEGFLFQYWYLSDQETSYVFSTPVTSDLTLTALWVEENTELTDQEKIAEDITAMEAAILTDDPYQLNVPIRGLVHRSTVRWTSQSDYISNAGIVLGLPKGSAPSEGNIVGEFTLNGIKVSHTFTIPLNPFDETVLSVTRNVLFENLTEEYEVADGSVDLYFEENGYVPYIKLLDFFGLLEGFIDPEVEFTIVEGEGTLEISYQYYDEDFDELYDLILTIDANENTITTNDPGFYWAYVYSTETNYGRHINYVADHPENYYEEGENIVYDLDDYQMDIVVYDGGIVLPYYIVNQLFAGSSYYNVYYNSDKLYGIYSLPEEGSIEYNTIRRSTMNNTDMPADLVVHNFNMLAFNMNNFYGLKDIMEVEDYYDILLPLKNKLLTDEAEDFEFGLRDFLLKTIDEPHTSYGYPSYFNKTTFKSSDLGLNSLATYGSRFQSWYYQGFVDVDDAIEAKWGTNPEGGWAAGAPARPDYWFLDSVTAVLILDDFYTADIEESASYDPLLANNALKAEDINLVLPAIALGTKYFYYNSSTQDNDMLELLVKGLSSDDLTPIHNALIALGYTFVSEETTNQDKKNGYYTLTIPESGEVPAKTYMVQIAFDEEFNLFYLGIMDKAPANFADAWPFTVDVNNTVQSDSAVFMEMVFDQILAEAPGLQNVILDLSWNTGGNVGALYRIVGFITDQPFAVSDINRGTGSKSTYHVQIDGVPDYSYLNWGLLITPLTFSAANEMATIFLQNDLGTIIGVQSGGGACSITPILLPNGTAFTMSSNNINAYRTGAGSPEDPYVYQHNEFGIPPDVIISVDDIYDVDTLLQIFN